MPSACLFPAVFLNTQWLSCPAFLGRALSLSPLPQVLPQVSPREPFKEEVLFGKWKVVTLRAQAVGSFPFTGFTRAPGQAVTPQAAWGTKVDIATVNSL